MIEYIILVSVVAAGICGIVITRNVFGSNEIHGKLNKMKQGLSISKDDFDEGNPLGSIGALIGQLAPMLPKNIQPLLQSPEAMGFIEKMVKDNPEKVGELIGKFVKKPKGNEAATVENMESV